MRTISVCGTCGSANIVHTGVRQCYCNECGAPRTSVNKTLMSPYERTRAAVYATGNKWDIENFNATH